MLRVGKDLRSLWSGEEGMLDWLCSVEGGLGQLGRMIGEEPVLVERQVRTAGGRADLVAELPLSGKTAVVEAQLNDADADHLGRLICYCADLEAEVGVLIARHVGQWIGELCAALNERPGRRLRLFALELSSVSDHKGRPLGAALHPPPGDAGEERGVPGLPEAGVILRVGPLVDEDGLRPALAGLLARGDPALAGVEGLEGRVGPLATAVEAGLGQDVMVWPEPVPAGMCSAIERILEARSRDLLVLFREGAEEAVWLLSSLRHALGIDLAACSYRLGPMIDGQRQIDFAPLPLPDPRSGEGPAAFWREVAARLSASGHRRIRTTSRQLSYRLDDGAGQIHVRYEMDGGSRRYLVTLRLRDGRKASANSILRHLRAHGDALRERLPGFDLGWIRARGGRPAQLRCRMAKRMSPPFALGDAAAVAEAVAAVDSVLRPLAKGIGDDIAR